MVKAWKTLLKTAINQRGKQTINRDAKTGGKINFTVRYLLWKRQQPQRSNSKILFHNQIRMLKSTNFILGGIRIFASYDNALKKQCLSRAEQSKNKLKLKEKAKTSKTLSNYTCLHPSKISQSDRAVCQVIRVLTKEYINPFDVTIEKNDLLNLSSGIPLQSMKFESLMKLAKRYMKYSLRNKYKRIQSPSMIPS